MEKGFSRTLIVRQQVMSQGNHLKGTMMKREPKRRNWKESMDSQYRMVPLGLSKLGRKLPILKNSFLYDVWNKYINIVGIILFQQIHCAGIIFLFTFLHFTIVPTVVWQAKQTKNTRRGVKQLASKAQYVLCSTMATCALFHKRAKRYSKSGDSKYIQRAPPVLGELGEARWARVLQS